MRRAPVTTTIEPRSLADWLETTRTDIQNGSALAWPWRLALAAIGLRVYAWLADRDGSILALTKHTRTNMIGSYRISRSPVTE